MLNKYCWGDKTKKNEMGGPCSAYGGEQGAYRVLVGKPEGLFGRRTPGFENNKTDLQIV